MKFQEKLYSLRKAADMTQTDLAEKLNVSRQAVSRWEMGTAMPDVDNLIAMSDLFGVTLDDLLKNKEDAPKGQVPPAVGDSHRYWDYVPKKWWLPLTGVVALRLGYLIYAIIFTTVPGFSNTMNQLINKNEFTQDLYMVLSPLGLFWLPRLLTGITICWFLWALVKWLKART